MKKILSAIIIIGSLFGSMSVKAIPRKCPDLSKIYSEVNMRLEDWEVYNYNSSLFSFGYTDNDMTLSISYVAAENKEAAISAAYDILNRVSEKPTTIFKNDKWLHCVYKDYEGYYLSIIYGHL